MADIVTMEQLRERKKQASASVVKKSIKNSILVGMQSDYYNDTDTMSLVTMVLGDGQHVFTVVPTALLGKIKNSPTVSVAIE